MRKAKHQMSILHHRTQSETIGFRLFILVDVEYLTHRGLFNNSEN
ncbi:MAG: hypothetical protein AAF849_22465 [Bacteroidota bacterium]